MIKRGQVTIFVIIGLVILAIGIFIYLFYPKLSSTLGFSDENPSSYLQKCMEKKVQESISELSLTGGEKDPENYFLYKNNKLKYLCYTNQYYITCVMQEPMLEKNFEENVAKEIESTANSCMESMTEYFKRRGYKVSLEEDNFKVDILPERISIIFVGGVTLEKGEEIREYNSLQISVESDIFDLVSIATSILDWEATYGDSETTSYMDNYHYLKVEKLKQSDGTTVYILTNRNSGEKFQFASRSLAWPPGW